MKSKILLPRIIIVGDQLAGKSLLIKAISKIKVLRSLGTCIKCPLNIIITANNKPSAS